MISRLKRQTKRRHSVQRDYSGIASREGARKLAVQIMQDLSFPPIGNVIDSRLSPDVFAGAVVTGTFILR